MKGLFTGLLILLSSNHCMAMPLKCPSVDAPLPSQSVWIEPPQSGNGPRAVALVVHGLNVQPEKMDTVARVLVGDGIAAYRASLRGHRGDLDEFMQITREEWVQDVFEAYCRARRVADQKKVPLYFVGYSLGALINLDLMNDFPESGVHYDKMVLFAPAAAVNGVSRLIKWLGILSQNFLVPSFSNETYRASCEGTPFSAYQALFGALDQLEKSQQKNSNIPTLVFVDPKDELVSESGILAQIQKNHLTQWRVSEVNNDGATLTHGAYHHLIIDEAAVGASQWAEIRKKMLEHLK